MFNRIEMKSYIESNGMKQKHVAEKAGISERALSLILTGGRKCNVDEYANICISLDVPFATFLDQHVS